MPAHHWLTWVLAVLALLFLAGSVYLWMQLDKSKKDLSAQRTTNQQLTDQVEKLKSQVGGEEAIGDDGNAACGYTFAEPFKANIKAALDSKNTAAFSTYTTNPVKYVLAASEMGGNFTPDQAASNLEYTHSAAGPWAYVDATGYSMGDYEDYFTDYTIAIKSADGMVVALEPNCDGSKISEIFVAPDEELL